MTLLTLWRDSSTDRTGLISPIGLQMVDDLTGGDPMGSVVCALFVEDSPGQWRSVEVRTGRSAGGIVIFPGLGRSRDPGTQPPRHYRAVITAQFYRPYYAITQDGFEFDIYPHNDDQPPAQAPGLQRVVLVPATNYPFQPHLRVLRGQVRNAAGPVANAEVFVTRDRVLSDDGGCYALPLRYELNSTPVAIDAVDNRTGEHGQINVTLPADLNRNNVIVIT